MMLAMSERTYSMAFGLETRRPACVLLQVAYGGDSHAVSEFFDTRHWLLSPSEKFAMVEGTAEQFRGHNERLNRMYPIEKSRNK